MATDWRQLVVEVEVNWNYAKPRQYLVVFAHFFWCPLVKLGGWWLGRKGLSLLPFVFFCAAFGCAELLAWFIARMADWLEIRVKRLYFIKCPLFHRYCPGEQPRHHWGHFAWTYALGVYVDKIVPTVEEGIGETLKEGYAWAWVVSNVSCGGGCNRRNSSWSF